MPDLTAKCGMDCGACPWGPYPRKNMTAGEFDEYRNNVKKILGYMPIRTACVACQTPDSEIPKTAKLPPRKCQVRQCVDRAGIRNCAYCSRFPCDSTEAIGGLWNRENIEKKLGAPISDQDYHSFVEPFEGLARLERIRASLKPSEIVAPVRVKPADTKVVDFPKNLRVPEGEKAAFRAVHTLLKGIKCSALGLKDPDTFAQSERLENRRAHVLRFLWILGCFGRFEKDDSACLVVDAESYISNRGSEKTLAIWSFVRDTVFKILCEHGVVCQRPVLRGFKEEDLTTGTGYLRNAGWAMKMMFEERIGGASALKALHEYAAKLDKRYGRKAFQRFSGVDMEVLLGD